MAWSITWAALLVEPRAREVRTLQDGARCSLGPGVLGVHPAAHCPLPGVPLHGEVHILGLGLKPESHSGAGAGAGEEGWCLGPEAGGEQSGDVAATRAL